jgi:hypothetical protein
MVNVLDVCFTHCLRILAYRGSEFAARILTESGLNVVMKVSI